MNKLEIPLNKPLYVYQKPMFMLTVSTVLIIENGVIVLKDVLESEQSVNTVSSFDKPSSIEYRFPGGVVRASQETVQFAAIRYVKEQIGITLKKELLIPVDFRSSPDRSEEGNVVDIGFVCELDSIMPDYMFDKPKAKWMEVNFEEKTLLKDNLLNEEFYMDHGILLRWAVDWSLIVK